MARKYRKRTDEEKALDMVRTGKHEIGAVGWMQAKGYIERHPKTGEWILSEAGDTWFSQSRRR